MRHTLVCGLLIITIIFVADVFAHSPAFTSTFRQEECRFISEGRNPFFVLEPGFTLVLEGEDEGEQVRLVITVLDQTKIIDGVETRVVRERETVNGEVVEVSKNYFAICKPTNSVFYFGEDVNNYEDGMVINHDGSWRAGVAGATAGIIMPGTLLIGSRYFQEVAPGIAEDRAEIVALDAAVTTEFDSFTDCLKVRESSPLEPNVKEIKYHAPGIGLIKDGELELVEVETAEGRVYPQ